MLPNTTYSLDKLERIFNKMGYKIRYEKGNFKTGACVLQSSKVIVVNRFLDLEAKIQALTDLMAGLDMEDYGEVLDDKQKQLFLRIKQTKLEI